MFLCAMEFLAVAYLFWSAPHLPPEITVYRNNRELTDQARTVEEDYFRDFPNITKKFYPYFDAAEQACVNIYSSRYKSPVEALEDYTFEIRMLRDLLPKTIILLMAILLICLVSGGFIYFEKHSTMAALILTLSALAAFPIFTEAVIGMGNTFIFYWTAPMLIAGIYFLAPRVFDRVFAPQKTTLAITPLKDIFIGLGIAFFGSLVAVVSITASRALGSRVIATGPIIIALYGLYRSAMATVRLLTGGKGFRMKRSADYPGASKPPHRQAEYLGRRIEGGLGLESMTDNSQVSYRQGTDEGADMKCSACGADVIPADNYCGHCGRNIKNYRETTAPDSPVAGPSKTEADSGREQHNYITNSIGQKFVLVPSVDSRIQ